MRMHVNPNLLVKRNEGDKKFVGAQFFFFFRLGEETTAIIDSDDNNTFYYALDVIVCDVHDNKAIKYRVSNAMVFMSGRDT